MTKTVASIVNINGHVFWSQKTWIICIVNWIICILNAAYFSVARTFEYTVRFVSLLGFLLVLSFFFRSSFFLSSIKWNITNRYNILFSSFTFFDVCWCCCNRLVFIYEFILLVSFFLVFYSVQFSLFFFVNIHFHHVVEIYFWIHQIGFSLFLSMVHYCWCFCSLLVMFFFVHRQSLSLTRFACSVFGPVLFSHCALLLLVMWTNAFSISIIF